MIKLKRSRATSNETLAYGNDISYALQKYWPAFTVEDVYELAKLYPTKDFGSSLQRRLDLTGDATVRCAVSVHNPTFKAVLRLLQGTIMADAYSSTTKAWLYRYNQPNPTWGSPLVAHAAENWMMFLGANSGYASYSHSLNTEFKIFADLMERQPSLL